MQRFKQHCRYVKGVPFVNRTVYERVSYKKKECIRKGKGLDLGAGPPFPPPLTKLY